MENELQYLLIELESDLESLRMSIPSFEDDEYEAADTIKEKMNYIRERLESVTSEIDECNYKLDQIDDEIESEVDE